MSRFLFLLALRSPDQTISCCTIFGFWISAFFNPHRGKAAPHFRRARVSGSAKPWFQEFMIKWCVIVFVEMWMMFSATSPIQHFFGHIGVIPKNRSMKLRVLRVVAYVRKMSHSVTSKTRFLNGKSLKMGQTKKNLKTWQKTRGRTGRTAVAAVTADEKKYKKSMI